jgi:hypothetical protein
MMPALADVELERGFEGRRRQIAKAQDISKPEQAE